MTTIRVCRRGGAGKYEIWARCRDPQRWPEWARPVREVRAEGKLRPGLEGEVLGPFGLRATFEVLDVDEPRRWTWVVRSGPIRLRVEHELAEGRAGLVITGPVAAVLVCLPVARGALGRLVAR